ncbi:MAG TPA: TolC family protein [Thermodesulfovibrionales bacterium]|nr:TolC family protein [Thermodesulfovibrionales bacterium]
MLIGLWLLLMVAGDAAADVLTLTDGLKIIAEKSRSIRISRSDEQIAEADSLAVRARLLPAVQAAGGWSALSHEPTARFGQQQVPTAESTFFFYSLNVQQTLFDFRGNASRYDASRSVLSAATLETRRSANLAAIEFVMAYLDLLEKEKIVTVLENEKAALEAHRKNAGSLYQEGAITKNDLLQAEVKLSDAEQRLLTARTFRTLQASRLNSLLLRPLNDPVQTEEVGDKTIDVPPAASLESAWKLAEQERAELRIADETLRALGFEETAKRSEYFPKLFVRGGYDFTENRYMVHEGNWSVTLGLSLSLFNGGETAAALKRIGYQKEKLLELREKLRDEICLEVEQAVLQAVTARDRLSVTRDAVQQAQENLRINRIKYEEGIGTGTDVVDAVALLSVARTNQYKALYDLRKAEAAVYYATGKDLLEVYR